MSGNKRPHTYSSIARVQSVVAATITHTHSTLVGTVKKVESCSSVVSHSSIGVGAASVAAVSSFECVLPELSEDFTVGERRRFHFSTKIMAFL